MRRMLFGEHLGRFVKLTGHDVEEIMEDQSSSRRRFGEIALSWGLCQPEHVWQAWCCQLSNRTQKVNLKEVGVDAQATARVPRHVATRYRVMPLRTFSDQLILAADEGTLEWAASQVPQLLRSKVKFVVADAGQIGKALRTYYPAPPPRSEAD